MTIRFIKQWNGHDDQDVVTLNEDEENRLVRLGIAIKYVKKYKELNAVIKNKYNKIVSQKARRNTEVANPNGLGGAGTWARLRSVPFHFDNVRIGLVNLDTSVTAVGVKAAIAATDSLTLTGQTYGNFVAIRNGARSDSSWIPVTFSGASTVTLPVYGNGVITWSDWMPCSSVPRFDIPGALPLILEYVEFPATGLGNVGYQTNNATYNPAVEAQMPGRIERSWANLGTFVTNPAGFNQTTTPSGLGYQTIMQFMPRAGNGKSLVAFGDSTFEGYGIASDFSRTGWIAKACHLAGVTCENNGQSGANLTTYKALFNNEYTEFVGVNTLLWLVHSVNSNNPPIRTSVDAAKAAALDVIKKCAEREINVVLVASMPNATTAQSNATVDLINELFNFCDEMSQIETVYHCDVSKLHLTRGQWNPIYNQDALHQNVLAENEVLVPALLEILRAT